MSGLKTVPVTMPDWLWWRLAKEADSRGIPVAGLIADALRQQIDANPRTRKPAPPTALGLLLSEIEAAQAAGWRAPGTHEKTRRRREGK